MIANTHEDQLPNSSMSLGDHIEELRRRIILALIGLAIGTIVGFTIGTRVIALMEEPYINVMGTEARLQCLAPADGFASYMRISVMTGLLITSPWIFYHLWMFIAAGLYKHEKRYIYYAIPFSTVLFVAGGAFAIFFIIPLTIKFLIIFNHKMLGIDSRFTFTKYISFVTGLMLVFGLGFQTPIAVLVTNKVGIVSIDALRKSRKYVLLALFVIAAIATPPDFVSQIGLAIPLYLLFELGIFLCGRTISNKQ